MQKKTRTQVIQELEREQTMRRKVWKSVKKYDDYQFTDLKQQEAYSRIDFLLHVLHNIPDAEFEKLVTDVIRRVDSRTVTTPTLF